jgi:hypothetical protein
MFEQFIAHKKYFNDKYTKLEISEILCKVSILDFLDWNFSRKSNNLFFNKNEWLIKTSYKSVESKFLLMKIKILLLEVNILFQPCLYKNKNVNKSNQNISNW